MFYPFLKIFNRIIRYESEISLKIDMKNVLLKAVIN